MSAQEYIFTIRLDDGSQAQARAEDPASVAKLRKMMADPKWARRPVRVASAGGDTSGHMIADDTLAVSLTLEGDVEGHTMTLRFPSAEEARRAQKRLLIGGILAASIVAGVAGAQLATQQSQTAIPQAGPAITVPAPAERVGPISPAKDAKDARDSVAISGPSTIAVPGSTTPGAVDSQLRDASAISGATSPSGVISPSKDAKDAQASGESTATDSATDSSPSGPGSRTTYPQ